MKKILTIAMLLFSLVSYAQGNLQFNRVLNFKSSNSYTVPVGKVLKIVSINAPTNCNLNLPLTSCTNTYAGISPTTDCNYNYSNFPYLIISNQNYTISYGYNHRLNYHNQCSSCPPQWSTTVTSTTFNNLKLPIWLDAGEIVSLAQIEGLLISAIEFNIIP